MSSKRNIAREEHKTIRIKKRKTKGIIFKRLIVIIFFVFVATRFFAQQPYIEKYNTQIKDLEQRIAEQKKIAEEIERKRELYQSDEFKAQLARDRLGMVESDERVYIDISGK